MGIDKTYKITFGRHLKYILTSLLLFLIPPGFYLYFLISNKDSVPFGVIIWIWVLLGIFYIIGFILHVSYYLNDKNKNVSIDQSNISIQNRTDSYSFKIEEIESITNHHTGLRNNAPWNGYEYSVFRLKNGKEFIITCLLLDLATISKTFQNTELIKKNHFIAFLNKKEILLPTGQ